MKKFLAAVQASLVLFAMAMTGTALASETRGEGSVDPAAMTGAYYMRDSLVPRADDLPLIQRKPALYVASFNDGMATVAYSLDQGRIVYRVVKGAIDAGAREEIDRALSKLQRKLA